MTIEEAIRNAAEKLRAAELSDPRREASLLIAHVLEGDREVIFREPEKKLTEKELTHFNDDGDPSMVDINHKENTVRVARATGKITMKPETLKKIKA